MKSFMVSKKPQILFGENTSAQVGSKFRELGCKKVFVVCDPVLRKMGLFEHVFTSLKEAEVQAIIFDEVTTDPPVELVDRAARQAVDEQVDGILGLGGGSCMDVAKGVNNLLHNEFPIKDYLWPNAKSVVPGSSAPLILIPTTSGTGSEVSDAAVFYDAELNMKRGTKNEANLASLSIVDPVFGRSMPRALTGQSGLDTMTHAIECMTTETRNLMSSTLAARSLELVWENLPRALDNGDDLDVRAYLSFAGMAAAMGFTDAGTHVGHLTAHQIGAKFHIPHGECCAMVAPALLVFLEDKLPAEIRMIAKAVGVDPASAAPGRDSAEAVKSLARKAGLRSATACGIRKEDLLALAPEIYNSVKNQWSAPAEIKNAGEAGCVEILTMIAEAE